jgi:hypothetical protein
VIDKNREYQLRLIDKYKESINVYWGALLTINGLLLTFFSIDSLSSSERWIILNYLLVGSCVLSLWLLIWNFKTIKKNYQHLGSYTIDDLPDVPENIHKMAKNEDEIRELVSEHTAEWRKDDLKKAGRRQKNMMIREKIIEWLLIAETLLVVSIILTRKCS